MTRTGAQIAEQLQAAGVVSLSWHIADRDYALPTVNFLRRAFASALWSFQNFFAVLSWTEEANDCDDFARISAGFAQILHYLTPGRPAQSALAVGEFWYQKDNFGGGHAINVACCGLEPSDVVFYEPQTRTVVHLSDTEKANATMVRF